MKISEILGD